MLVDDVQGGSPAKKSGLRSGDVIVQVDGVKTDTAAQLRNMVAMAGAGKQVDLEVVRGSKDVSVRVKFGELPANIK